MRSCNTMLASAAISLLLAVCPAQAEMAEFDTDKIMAELERQLELSSEALAELEPALDAKSEALKQSIDETVERGFMELDKLSEQLAAASKQAEEQLRGALNSEEIRRLGDALESIDQEAISETQERIVEELTEFLKLSQEQLSELKPVLLDAFDQLNAMLSDLATQGYKQLEEFTERYEALTEQLRQAMKDILNSKQLNDLDSHRDQLKEKIEVELFEI